MRLTKELKAWLVQKYGIAVDATDAEFKAKAAEALTNGELTAEKLVELTTGQEEKEVDEFITKFDALTKQIGGVMELLAKNSETPETKEAPKAEEKAVDPTPEAPKRPLSNLEKAVASLGHYPVDEEKTVEIRVKEAVESYDGSRKSAVFPEKTKRGGAHPLAGDPVRYNGESYNTVSERDKAQVGAWLKFHIATSPGIQGSMSADRVWAQLSEHDKSLLAHLAEKGEWYDCTSDTETKTKGYMGKHGTGIKALIDDSTSGGTEAAPIVFDAMVIETPLLYGELFPLVTTVPLARGRRVEGVAVSTVTGSWGGVDETDISYFNTASYVTAFDTTIYRWQGAVRIGLDFLSDTPIDFAETFIRQYGERLLEELDDVIAIGNGTNQPEGVMNKTGTTSVGFGGTTTLSNYESLRFAVKKAEHKGPVGKTAIFCGNETSYSRAIGIPVSATDTRRVFGTMNGPAYDSFSIMNRPYKINESLANTQVFYGIMARYRMYRRKDMVVRTSTEGAALIRANSMLIAVMARFGGQCERSQPFAKSTTAEA